MKAKLILIGVGGAVVIAALWFFLLWKPQGDHLSKAKADKAAAQVRVDQLSTQLAHLKKLEANAAVLERDRALLAAAIPSSDQLDAFILSTNEKAATAGVSFVSISPQQPGAANAAPGAAAASGPQVVGLQIQVTGDYFAILRFLEALRDGDRLVTVENFSLSKGGEGNQMSASIGGRMFVNPAQAAAAPAPTPSA
ncbi:MAG TPA: type 4a pilus biogenesis protein PilO [Acidimicrobiales bacterium]|nr:type 4a pilus biogenesis protein PilO [Acidimicrobiales bacterium]